MTNAGATAVFKVSDPESLTLSLTWSVNSSALGHILSSAGNTGIYESYGGTGNNVVKAKDQYGREATAVVNQM